MKGEIIMADIKKIKLPNGTTYNLKDSEARTSITNITEGTTKLPYGKSLSITNNVELNLLDPDNNVLSTVNLPSGGVVQIYKKSDGTWLKTGTSDNLYDMDLGTVVRFTGGGKGLADFGKVKLIAASSEYPYNDTSSTFYTSIKAGGFVGVIVGKITASQTTVIKRIDEDGTIFPDYYNRTVSDWIANYPTLDALEKWFSNHYSIISKSEVSSSDLGVTSLDGTTTYTVLEARLLKLPRDMVALMIQLSEYPNEALKFSKDVITCHNWSVIGWGSTGNASMRLPEVNSDKTIQMPSSWSNTRDIGILYGHTI